MARINENELAKRITIREGGVIRISIAQVKEILRCLKDELASDTEAYPSSDILRMFGR